jgi:hypothetical protein
VIGHGQPFFAPISAIIALGVTPSRRRRRAVEIVLGVALGILVADAIISLTGTGTIAIGVGVAVAMSAAIALGGGPLVATQAGTSAVLVATLPGAGGGTRFVDVLVGGVLGIAVHALLPVSPLRTARSAIDPVVEELADVLEDVGAALRDADPGSAETAMFRARDLASLAAGSREALAFAGETAALAPQRRRERAPLAGYLTVQPQLDLAIRDVRVLARAALRAIEVGDPIPGLVPDALEELAEAVRRVGEELRSEAGPGPAREAAVRAAACATRALDEEHNLGVSMIVGQVRATAVDLLRGLGLDRAEARQLVRQAPAEPAGAS